MSDTTAKYGLKKPRKTDPYNIEDHNKNMDIIAGELSKMENDFKQLDAKALFLLAHPVGSIFMTMSKGNPTEDYGGTWQRIAKGKAIFGVEDDDGDMSVAGTRDFGSNSRTLAVANLPGHTHNTPVHNHSGTTTGAGAHDHDLRGYGATLGPGKEGWRFGKLGSKTGDGILVKAPNHAHSITLGGGSGVTSVTGSGTAFDNRPAGIAVYIWQRTA